MSDLELEQAVELGAEWLNEHRPNWFNHISPDTLRTHDGCGCVLGQSFGHFSLGITAAGFAKNEPWISWACNHGFGADQKLVPFWRAKIIALRAPVELPSQSGAAVESAAKCGAT
jgi:hypothetical protein